MPIGLIGRKGGMTRVFTGGGESIPVTIVIVEPNRVIRLKTRESDGYRAVQVTCGTKKPSRVSRPQAGHFVKHGVEAGEGLWEFRLEDGEGEDLAPSRIVDVRTTFEVGQRVDTTGTSIGKGYAGVVKRHNFRTQDASHGNSLAHRAPGSIGQNQTPGRVFKGKKMAGHMGNVRRTIQNLEIVRIDEDRNSLLIKGSIPGPRGGRVIVRPAKEEEPLSEEG